LNDYRKDHHWRRYEQRFIKLMDERNIPSTLNKWEYEISSCLLCSEATAEHCHRRLLAERMSAHWPDVEIVHL
jgi:hypothetical protein